jgi:S1-C subfamily serine protease
VTEVSAGSPADRAGFRENDLIVVFAGKTVGSVNELGNVLQDCRPNEQVEVIVRRGDATTTLRLVLGRRP